MGEEKLLFVLKPISRFPAMLMDLVRWTDGQTDEQHSSIPVCNVSVILINKPQFVGLRTDIKLYL